MYYRATTKLTRNIKKPSSVRHRCVDVATGTKSKTKVIRYIKITELPR